LVGVIEPELPESGFFHDEVWPVRPLSSAAAAFCAASFLVAALIDPAAGGFDRTAVGLHHLGSQLGGQAIAPPDEVKFAKRVLEAMPDGRGVLMLDGKMQDDATWKQCKVMVSLAQMLSAKDPELKAQYGF
jgi:hypothetical protein